MKRNFLLSLFALLFIGVANPLAASADSSHARIVRLSQIQGDVRFTREFHGDPTTDLKAVWETAQLNLPIRQGNVLSTGNGRAEVEFENGAMAFLGANSILEFFDLSLNDGSRVTRLILRQGSASFYDRSQNGDYFSVTGGDFSVEVSGRATFRLENFDNGSTVTVQNGRVIVLQDENPTPLEKGHSLTVNSQDSANPVIAQAAPSDEFDRWVSNRIQNEQTVTSQAVPNSGSTVYASGYADLYTYGSWMNVNGSNCWRPFGMGLGWSPFDYGSWYFDGGLGGWGFIGSAPWGWLPYHYGGWYFSPVFGWVWNPGNSFYGRPQPYRPVTAVFVHSGNSTGIVPLNPGDKSGRTPLNLSRGVYPLQGGAIGKPVPVASGEKWSVLNNSHALALSSTTAVATPPVHVSRALAPPNNSARETTFGRGSSIVYDPSEHRFINSSQARVNEAPGAVPTNEMRSAAKKTGSGALIGTTKSTPALPASAKSSSTPSSNMRTAVPPRPPAAPARGSVGGGSSSPSSSWGGGGGSSVGSARSSGSSSGPSSHPSGSSGGGRPH